jgi:hypothetical protein
MRISFRTGAEYEKKKVIYVVWALIQTIALFYLRDLRDLRPYLQC